MGRKNGARPESNGDHLPGREAPGQPPSRARFFKQETTITATIERISERIAEVVDTCQFFAEVVVPCLFHFRNLCLIVAFETWLLSRLLFSSNLCDSLPTSKTKQSKDTQNADDLTRPGPRPGEFIPP